MPLPPGLLAKLSKRGLITAKPRIEVKVITSYKGFEGCPNKSNIFHECTKFCIIRWKVGVLEPKIKYKKRRDKILKRYPLPLNWKEIYDRGSGRFYYWDTDKDLVSWLPPKHPRSIPLYSAAYLREEMQVRLAHKEKQELEGKWKSNINEERENPRDKSGSSRSSSYKGYKKSSQVIKNYHHLDPMDPAAYSDIPRGSWSTGLETQTDAKTGADTTVPGPLFQMRPYPSPGSVLAANSKKRSKFLD